MSDFLEREIDYSTTSFFKKEVVKQGIVRSFYISKNSFEFVLNDGVLIQILFFSKSSISGGNKRARSSRRLKQQQMQKLKYQEYLTKVSNDMFYPGSSSGMLPYSPSSLKNDDLNSDRGQPSSRKVIYFDESNNQHHEVIYLKEKGLYTADDSPISIVFKEKKTT